MNDAECSIAGCRGRHHARGFCNKHYERWRVHGDPLREITVSDRFWAKVDRSDSDGCWLWTAATISRGYGWFGVGHRQIEYAHRVSWQMHHGPIPEGLYVCHRCDTPPCVNPAHLFLGTHAENVADMDAKGRRRSHPHFGEANPLAKLTVDRVQEIRRRGAEGESGVSLALAFGVSTNTISRVLSRKTWRTA